MKKFSFYLLVFILLIVANNAFSQNKAEVYARTFAPLKDKPIKFLGIGIGNGDNVKLWEDYFKNGHLYFLDANFSQIEYYSDRSLYLWANQECPQALQNAIVKIGSDFDLIIESDGDTKNQQIVSFQTLFPHVKKGGMYIIEGLDASYSIDDVTIESIRFYDRLAIITKK